MDSKGARGKALEEVGESGRERPLEARKISKHDSVSNSLFTLDLGRGKGRREGWSEPPILYARETFVIFHRAFPCN